MASTSSVATPNDIYVPETLLRKRKSQEKAREERALATKEKREKEKKKRQVTFTRAEKLIKEYRDGHKDRIRLVREAKKSTSLYVVGEEKLLFVVRTKGMAKIDGKKRKALGLLRLLQSDHGVFIRLTKTTAEMLEVVSPLVAYGYPNQKSVRELIYKRGYGKVDQERVPLTDNEVIEQNLGKYGIICMEDLIHEIFTVGPNFKQASNFLWPFKLNSRNGDNRKRKFRHLIESGAVGNQKDDINELIRQMN